MPPITPESSGPNEVDVAVIGGGQSALATAYFLRRSALSYVLLDAEEGPGGAWRHAWNSLRLFSTAGSSWIAGRVMRPQQGSYPSRDDVISYLSDYERHYELTMQRPVWVQTVRHEDGRFRVVSGARHWQARYLVSATGTWRNPYIPSYDGMHEYMGEQLHSANYVQAEAFVGKRVLIVGGGNSAAQILAEVSAVARTTWVTLAPPRFLPDEVDGHVLFAQATERLRAQMEGRAVEVPAGGLGDIVMVPSVRTARARGVLRSVRPFERFTRKGVVWPGGTEEAIDAVIWCTGFRAALGHLADLDVMEPDGRVLVDGTRSVKCPRLWLVGYGDWVGPASATLIGVTRTARSTVAEIQNADGPTASAPTAAQ